MADEQNFVIAVAVWRHQVPSQVPLSVRLSLWGLLAHLAMTIDLIPDFIPVLDYADDATIVAFVLRFVARRGTPKLAEHWQGTTQGLAAVQRLVRITDGWPPAT